MTPGIAALAGELATGSDEFRAWPAQPHPPGHTTGRKRFNHPLTGPLLIGGEAFTPPGECGAAGRPQ